MRSNLTKFTNTIGYTFRNVSLLDDAMRHRSVPGKNNERLEFLGDSILNFLIADELYKRYPKAKEGDLSRLRASLVKGETLAAVAMQLNLGDFLRLGSGELKSGGYRRESILADGLEALIAAIYIDDGVETCRQCLLRWYGTRLDNLNIDESAKDPKSKLQEVLQAYKLDLPIYKVISIEGHAHDQVFNVECSIEAFSCNAQASGNTRRKAEQAAAACVLEMIETKVLNK